jgi:hypothetical protein
MNYLEGTLSCSSALSLICGINIGAKAVLDINLISLSPIPVGRRRVFYLLK